MFGAWIKRSSLKRPIKGFMLARTDGLRGIRLVSIAGVFVVFGTVVILGSRAAWPVTAFELESGTLTSPASVVMPSGASGTGAVKFGGSGVGTITNGQQINPGNVGWQAYPAGCPGGLTIYNSQVSTSSMPGHASTCGWFKAGINVDSNASITAARIDLTNIDTHGYTLNISWSNLDSITQCDEPLHGEGVFNVYRSSTTGCSDGPRMDGDSVIESYVRTHAWSTLDHNDGMQAYLASAGSTILRNNIDGRPDNGAAMGVAWGNSAIFMADDSQGTTKIRDNYLAGGGYTLRMHESQLYRVTGNIIVKDSWAFGPLSTSNAVSGAFLEWSNNTISDGTVLPHP